jgi:hypothetical protein
MNRTLIQMLRSYVDYTQSDWATWLPHVEFAYNDSLHVSTGMTPFFLNYGMHPISPTALLFLASWGEGGDTSPAVDYIHRMHEVVDMARQKLKTAQAAQKAQADSSRRHILFKVGDQVMVSTKHLRFPEWQSYKLGPQFVGPYKVTRRISEVTYELELPEHVKSHNVFHVSRLRPYKSPVAAHQQQVVHQPAPDVVDGHEEFEVECIVGKRYTRGGWQYRVKWVGYGPQHNKWLPLRNLHHCMDLVREYEDKISYQHSD